ncbi:MAG TPA: pitrilysin family protein [Candidatus Acidoferrales bacterium]|nr:pitrilysin family protein [Candidatus Acidoferrales bacterium]
MRKANPIFLLLLLLAVSLAANPAPAQKVRHAERPKSPTTDLPKIEFEKYKLPNGLEVILSEDHRLPMLAVNVWYHVGPANEVPGRTGFAHLFEHMMFQGSKHVGSNEHFRLLEGAGASDINGTTGFDRTNYFETLPANQLELALWLESDRMGYLLDKLDQANLSNQQDVVRNERRQGLENQPYGIVEEGLFHLLFPAAHPYYASVIGSHADIQAAKLEDVKKFFKLYYAPNNATLAIVGDFDKPAAKKLVARYFGPLKSGANVPKINVLTPPITSERRAVIEDRVELPRVYMAWLTSPIYKEGDAEMDLAAAILGGGKSSRLYKKLVYEKQIAQDVAVDQQSVILGSVFEMRVTARPGHSAEEIEKAIDEEMERFCREGPEQKELERARNGIETRIIQGLETLGGFGGVADRLNQYNHYLGNPDFLSQDIARYRKASVLSVRALAQQQLKPSARVVVYGVPGTQDLGPEVPTPKTEKVPTGTGAESVNADEPWRAAPPKAGAPRPLNLPVPKSFRLANGLTVIYNQRPGLPVVAANLVVRTGSDANPPDKPGLANFTVTMLDQGTSKRNALQIADEAAQLGAELNTSSTTDASMLTVRALKMNFPPALGLLADLALHSSFPQEEIDRQRASRLASLDQRRQNPATVASQVMEAALYGPRHPYGYPEIGTEASIKATAREDLVAFWKQNFAPNNAALVVAGNIGLEELKALAETHFGTWQRRSPAKAALGVPATTSAKLVLVDKPGAPQTRLRVAIVGAPRSTPDYAPLEVMNASLGGLFSSRINLNLREEHGYTYGAFSQFVYRRSAGPFFVSSGVRTDVTAPAVTEIFKEVRRMAATPLTAEELRLAKDSLVRSLPGDFETSPGAATSFSRLYIYDLGLDYYSQLPERLSSITSEAAQAVAKKYLVPEEMVTIAVGDRAKIEPELAKLNLGPVEIRDADGNVIKK